MTMTNEPSRVDRDDNDNEQSGMNNEWWGKRARANQERRAGHHHHHLCEQMGGANGWGHEGRWGWGSSTPASSAAAASNRFAREFFCYYSRDPSLACAKEVS
jgi:hypothetical protein